MLMFMGKKLTDFTFAATSYKFKRSSVVMFWLFDPAKIAIQGDAPEGSDTF